MTYIKKTFQEALAGQEFHERATFFEGYAGDDFLYEVSAVFEEMVGVGSDVVTLSWDCDMYGVVGGAKVEVFVHTVTAAPLGNEAVALIHYGLLGPYLDVRDLTTDRDATGIAGYEAIWDALTDALHTAEALVRGQLAT